jgi:cysteine desulfurase / selenocysteine lyase
MTSRRQFIRLSSSAATALILPEFSLPSMPDALKTHGRMVGTEEEQYWGMVRQQFPLAKDKIYLNNGTMGPSPFPVIEAVKNNMMDVDVNGNYGGWEATAAKLAGYVGTREDEIALTHNVTDGINIVCWGLALKKGDEVILTTHEHVGNALPWLNRSKLHGIVIRTFTPAMTAAETLSRIEALINKKTRVIAVPHIPCTNGQVLPAKEISSLGKSKGLFVFLDGAHGPGMLDLNISDLGCDFYASCTHKWMLGPKGTGFLYVKKEMQDQLQAYFVGGGSDGGWNMLSNPPVLDAYAASAHRYYYGTQSSALYAGVIAAIEFSKTIGIKNIHNRICSMADHFQQGLLSLGDRIEMVTPVEKISKAAVVAFLKKMPYDKFYGVAAENKIRIRSVPENGLNCLRVSSHIYNNKEELDSLLDLISRNS